MIYLSESQFNELCQKCDSIINKDKNSPSRIANSFLHVIRNHPISLLKYKEIFSDISLFKFYLIGFIKFLYFVIISFSRFFRFNSKNNYGFKHDKFEHLFISHFFDEKHLNKEQDFYYFKLPSFVEGSKSKSLIAYINHKRSNSKLNKLKEDRLNRYLLPFQISFYEELLITKNLLKDSLKIFLIKNKTKTEKKFVFKQQLIQFLPNLILILD